MTATWVDVTAPEVAHDIHDRMMDAPPVVSLGVPQLDKAMMTWGQGKGIPRGTYVIVGGASNIGKTQYGLALLMEAAKVGERAGLVSLDMKRRDALLRLHAAMVADIPGSHWRPDRWRPEYEGALVEGLRRWRMGSPGGIGIVAPPVGDLDLVKTTIVDGVDAGCSFFVVDHLQKIRVGGYSDGQISARAEVVSETLDNLADTYDVTVVGLSQLNREATKQRDRSPRKEDLWGGTAMESNAAVVVMLDHSRYARDPQHHHIGRTYVLLDKNQMGPKGFDVPVLWDHRRLKIREALPDELGEWPGAAK